MKESEQLLAQGLPVLYECLKAKGQHSIETVPASPTRRRLVLTVKPQLEDPTCLDSRRLVTDYANRRFVDKSARRRRSRDPINFMAVNNSNRRDCQRADRLQFDTLRDERTGDENRPLFNSLVMFRRLLDLGVGKYRTGKHARR